MKGLRLVFRTPEKWDESSSYYQVEWPPTGNRLFARLDTFDSGKPSEVGEIYSRFVMANTPQDSNILFTIRTEQGKGEFEASLQSLGEPFQDMILPSRKSWFSKASREKRALAGSTRHSEIVRRLFEDYDVEWFSQSQFWFIISKRDLREYSEQLFNLSVEADKRVVRSTTVDDSYCILTTLWEHGMEILSNKVSRRRLEETARKVADEKGITLVIEDARPP